MQRGCAGVITDGGFRDSAEIAALGFPAYHQRPSAPTNLTLHQAIEINVPIGCGDAPVFPGDVILGDSDGVIVIPAHLADEIADEAVEMTAFEDFRHRAGAQAAARSSASTPQPTSRRRRILRLGARRTGGNMPLAGIQNDVNSENHIMLMFNNLIDGEWLSDGARAPNVNPSDTKDIVGEACAARVRKPRLRLRLQSGVSRPGRDRRRKRATTS
jgi:hypothetical protein